MAFDELDTWKKWKKRRTKKRLGQLLEHVDPVIQRNVDKFTGVPIPRIAIEAEAKKQAVAAFNNFNPKKGASLKTHVGYRMNKLFRYVSHRQNIGRMPEHRTAKVGLFKKTKEYMEEEKGREPTTIEIADELGWSPQEVSRMEAELRKDLGHSLSFQDTAFVDFNRNMELINFAYYSLTPNEQLIYDYAVGAHGKAQLKTSEIAKKMKISTSQVSKLKKTVFNKIKRHTT